MCVPCILCSSLPIPTNMCVCVFGSGSSVGIATEYGLDGPESSPGGEEIFRPSRPPLGPTQPPVNGYLVFPGGGGGKSAAGAGC